MWIDGSPLSFQKWQNPRPSFGKFTKGEEYSIDKINYDSYILNSEQLLQPIAIGPYNESLCTGFVIYSSLNLEWVLLPCDRKFSKVLVICEGPYKAQKRDVLGQRRLLPRQYAECGANWTMISNSCYQMFNIPKNKNMSCFDLVAKCQTEMSTLAGVPENWKGKVKEHKTINYFFSWLCTENDVLHGMVARDGNKCSAWQIRISLTFFALNITNHQRQLHGSFICNRKPILVSIFCQLNQFQCADGTCILSHYECDGSADCPDASDELDCMNICNALQNFGNSSITLFCYDNCFPGECSCHDLYYQCGSGGCVSASKLCDGTADCKQGEDEVFCPSQNQSLLPLTAPEAQFICSSGSVIPLVLVNDLIPDCSGGVADDEVLLQEFWLNYERCA